MTGAVILLAALLAADVPLRDPFWPVGYEGERRVISAELRFAPSAEEPAAEPVAEEPAAKSVPAAKTAAEADAAAEEPGADVRWSEASRSLRFGGLVGMRSADGQSASSAMLVNGRACSAGDSICVDYRGFRYFWRVERGEDERKLRLVRIRADRLGEESSKEKRQQ